MLRDSEVLIEMETFRTLSVNLYQIYYSRPLDCKVRTAIIYSTVAGSAIVTPDLSERKQISQKKEKLASVFKLHFGFILALRTTL